MVGMGGLPPPPNNPITFTLESTCGFKVGDVAKEEEEEFKLVER